MLFLDWLRHLHRRNRFESFRRRARRAWWHRMERYVPALERLEDRILLTPVAHNDAYETPHGWMLDVLDPGVLDNDEPQGFLHAAVVDSLPANGTLYDSSGVLLAIDDEFSGGFQYVPGTAFIGTDSFTYHAHDGVEDSNTATVTIDVYNVVAEDDVYDVLPAPDGVLTVDALDGVLANDWDADGDPLDATLTSGPANGTLNYFNSDGSFEYVPAAGFAGTDTFVYSASDGLTSDSATVTIYVNSAPSPVPDDYSTAVDTTLSVPAAGVLANDYDAEGDSLTASLSSSPANGTLLEFNADGSFVYEPFAGFVGVDEFYYTVNDGRLTSSSDNARVRIFVGSATNPFGEQINDSALQASADSLYRDGYVAHTYEVACGCHSPHVELSYSPASPSPTPSSWSRPRCWPGSRCPTKSPRT
ncbi:MAG: tandem-95 repeat protein [Planctomycetes bacterium]|nr:tandem-95 repeat protein [Planctomycetota bacterium]